MSRPDKVKLTCKHCGHQWSEPTTTLIAQEAVIYKGKQETVTRRVVCPNCDKWVKVSVPKAWFDDE